jgi:hypothetical protein
MSPRPSAGAPWSPIDVDQRLQRYAADALAPDPSELSRGRSVMLAAFADRPVPASRGRGLGGWSLAAAFTLLLVAGAGLAAAESDPGEPFYGLRLAVGSLTLPGQEPAHARGLADQLDDRLAEAGIAARNGDGRAAQAAISEYLRTLSQLTHDGISDPGILALLQRHQDALQELLSVAPAQAAGGVQEALDAAGHASDVAPSDQTAAPRPTPPQNAGASPPATGKP